MMRSPEVSPAQFVRPCLVQNPNRSGRRVRPPPYRVAAVAERRTTGGLAFGSRSERTMTLSAHIQSVTSKSFGPFGCVRKKIVRKFWVQKIRTPFGRFFTAFRSSEPEIAAQGNLERSQKAQRREVLDQERPPASAPEASHSISGRKGSSRPIHRPWASRKIRPLARRWHEHH